MLMNGIDSRILILSTICLSFLNYAFVFSMHNKSNKMKLMGVAFFIPFCLCTTAFLFPMQTAVFSLIRLCDALLLAALLLAVADIKRDRNQRIREASYFILPVVISFYLIQAKSQYTASLLVQGKGIIEILLILSSLLLLKRQKNNEPRLYGAFASFLFSMVLNLFSEHRYMTEAYMLFRTAAYFLFFAYLSHTVNQRYASKVAETENLKDSLERALNVEVKKRTYAIERSNEKLLELSKTDLMTKAYNKITILNLIEKLISKKDTIFSIMMFDIDHFKTINDTLGHVTGDMCLKTLANIATNNIREMDYLGRYGGDEFIIVLPNLSTSEAKFVAERFRSKVSETSNPRFTVSIGISTFPQDGATVKELISAADSGLYRSKSRGRNAVSHQRLF